MSSSEVKPSIADGGLHTHFVTAAADVADAAAQAAAEHTIRIIQIADRPRMTAQTRRARRSF